MLVRFLHFDDFFADYIGEWRRPNRGGTSEEMNVVRFEAKQSLFQ